MSTILNPKLPESTLVLHEEENFLFLIPEKPDWLLVNGNMAKVLSYCDGTRSIEDIRKLIGDHPYASQAIEELQKICKSGFFDPACNQECHKNQTLLHSLHLNMTALCNLKCIYCYAEERNNAFNNYLNFDEYRSLVDDVFSINPSCTMTFTGGEPLLSENTIPVAKYCKEKGMPTFLLTNGCLVSPKNAQALADCFDTIRVSIDGASAPVHDILRGTGSFEKAMRGIALLEEHGKPPLVAMTVTNKNIQDIGPLAEKFGSRLTFQPLYNVGRARKLNLGVSGQEYYESLASEKTVEPYAQLSQHLLSLKNRGCTRCAMGDGELSVSPEGNVFPCHMLHEQRYLAGNIREQSFSEIYKNSMVLKEIRSFSVETKESCRSCPVRLLCGGGCWARAFLVNGDLNAPDPFCDYDFIAFQHGLLNSRAPENG